MKKRAFVRYSKQGKIVPGSLVLTSGSYPQGSSTWNEVPADLCCIPINLNKLTSVLGIYYLDDVYFPAVGAGRMTFPNHIGSIGSLNPNEIGQVNGITRTQLYINTYNNNGDNQTSKLSNLVNKGGKLILVQNGLYVVLGFTPQSFEGPRSVTPGNINIFAENLFENSLPGSITIEVPSAGDFNTTDPINIFIINN